ncbi:hypothetical protein K458DRAFT_428772 [Lentithecium fluviatile CBS 122367]|uniref:Uncharacterized protein n=1 Tax=Lentithecium fluviatile CBS 122367 TaxID=1168545 RepID=A0A6G1JBN2_9PLEO|nr:hypothetical protein K458DRAFT_428772 [Lentithecium fluviatile CBS 122367]
MSLVVSCLIPLDIEALPHRQRQLGRESRLANRSLDPASVDAAKICTTHYPTSPSPPTPTRTPVSSSFNSGTNKGATGAAPRARDGELAGAGDHPATRNSMIAILHEGSTPPRGFQLRLQGRD